MGRGVAWVTQALAVVLLAGAATAHAQMTVSVADLRTAELSSGLWMANIPVTLNNPAPGTITVDWAIVPGSATQTPGNDYFALPANGTVTFLFSEDTKTIPLQIRGDTLDEWTLPQTYHQDEVFFIQLSNPVNATIQKSRSTITLIDDDRPLPGVQFLSATSGGILTPATNKLKWRIPGAQVPPDDVTIRWNTGASCIFPTNVGGGSGGMSLGFAGLPGTVQIWTHSSAPGLQHCYSVFAIYGGSPTTEVAQVKATPFDTNAGPVAWRYSPGCYPPCAAATLAPPSVGFDATYTVGNDGVLHAMQRGPLGGAWPSSWNPLSLGKPTQSRSPAVPMRVVPTLGDWRLFVGTDGGGLHAVDGLTGSLLWSRSDAFSNALPSLTTGTSQAQPAGIFKAFGGQNDMLLVGTHNGVGNNSFLALDPATGNPQDSYSDPAMGDVRGMAVVDYAGNRVLFLTASAGATLYSLNLGAPMPDLTLGSLPVPLTNPNGFGSGTSGSAVLRNNRLIFGDSVDQIYAVNLVTGASYTRSTGNGPVKGFVWPDRRNNNLYFSADDKVHVVEDDGVSFNPLWEAGSIVGLSMVLQKPGTDYLYVGDGNGRLIQINVATQSQTPLVLEGPTVQIGAPSLDGPNNLIVVGSSTGTIHAVRVGVPF